MSAFVGPRAPEYVRELLDPEHLRAVGLFSPEAVERLVQKCESPGAAGVGETDEMGLVGTISVLLLQDRFVDRPALAQPAEPTRVVVGAQVRHTGTEPAYLLAEAG